MNDHGHDTLKLEWECECGQHVEPKGFIPEFAFDLGPDGRPCIHLNLFADDTGHGFSILIDRKQSIFLARQFLEALEELDAFLDRGNLN